MTIAMNEQGQITIPEEIRARLGWKQGTRLTFDVKENGELSLQPTLRGEEHIAPIEQVQDVDDLIWRGTTDEYMAWLRKGGPSFFDARRPGEKTFSQTAAENTAAFVKMRDAMRSKP
jgi:AbrB family looped-hinge helix DNA binding protein